ncbi:MAG: MarR family transcriptional regulator [Methylococcales bacterium]|nr:MarR family transcriptional regulator [Methylococcales bacterium]
MEKTSLETINNNVQPAFEALKRFRLIIKAVQQHSHLVETHCGVSSAQLWILWELTKTPGLKVTELARALSIHHSTASSLLDKLAKKGLIKRERISQDQRVVTLSLTEKANEIISLAPSHPRGIMQNALFELPENVLESLNLSLDLLIAKMQIIDDEATMQPISITFKARRNRKQPPE